MDDSNKRIYEEREFLHDIGVSLNAALFIVDRLTEEIKEEEGRLETDAEVEKLFHHLANYLVKIDSIVKSRHTDISRILDIEMQKEKGDRARLSPTSSP